MNKEDLKEIDKKYLFPPGCKFLAKDIISNLLVTSQVLLIQLFRQRLSHQSPQALFFCLEFVEIANVAKYKPGAWDKTEPKTHGGEDLSRSSLAFGALDEKKKIAREKRLWTSSNNNNSE